MKSTGTVFEFGEVFCFTDFLSGFLLRFRGRIKVRVGGCFRVRFRVWGSVRVRGGLGFIHFNQNLLELKLRPGGEKKDLEKMFHQSP